MTDAAAERPTSFPGRLEWAGYALGFGLGGFFDGILLHQILQWHHLLSVLEDRVQDIRFLILTDGVFHLLMYLVTGLGLWLLWKSRSAFAAPGADRRLLANALIGFGAWHLLDSVLSHWALGIHRIRMDVDNPLFWDLLWFGVFGVVPAVVGWAMRRKRSGRRTAVMSSPLALVLAAGVAAPLAALPPPGGDSPVLVLFWPGTTPEQSFAALRAVDGRLVWSHPSGQLWAIRMPEDADPTRLYGLGAMLVSKSVLPAGCLDWFRS